MFCVAQAPFPMVKRPGYGSKGKTVEVTSNLFRVGYSRLKGESNWVPLLAPRTLHPPTCR